MVQHMGGGSVVGLKKLYINPPINSRSSSAHQFLLTHYRHPPHHSFDGLLLLLLLLIALSNSLFISTMASSSRAAPNDTSTAVLIRVDQSGKGDFTKIQDAIDSVPDNNTELVFIWIKPGVYREKIMVPANKPYITLSGSNAANTTITWSQSGDIDDSATVTVRAPYFVGRYLTIKNTYGSGDRAVALWVSGERAAFYACRFHSYQDTIVDASGHHYFSNCFIEGAIDFIAGNATSIYEKCHMHYVAETDGGSITAQKSESPSEKSVFVFLRGKVTAAGKGKLYLGRPWGRYARVIYAKTYMANVVLPQGWDDWKKTSAHSTVFYAEYKCQGPGANRSKRVSWSHELTSAQADTYLTRNIIGGSAWLRSSPTKFKKGFSGNSRI